MIPPRRRVLRVFGGLCLGAACFASASRLPANYVSIGGAHRFQRRSTSQTMSHAENLNTGAADSRSEHSGPVAINPVAIVAAFAVCTSICVSNVQPAEAKPFKSTEFYGTEKRDNKGILHQLNAKIHERTRRTVVGQFLHDDGKRVELAAKRNGALFNMLGMDADKAEHVKAAMMSTGLLAGLVIANPGNAFPRPGPLK